MAPNKKLNRVMESETISKNEASPKCQMSRAKQLLFSFFIMLSFAVYSQERISWNYPIKPKTEEWKKLENNKAKVEACQIPEHILRDISTDDLMVLCLQYPLLYDVFAFNNITRGLEKLFADFNGIREFSKREKAVNSLREQYLSEIYSFPDKPNKVSNLDLGRSMARISILELLLSYSDFLDNTSKENQKKVLESLLSGYQEKIKYSEYFGRRGFTSNIFARAHLIIKIDTALLEKFENRNKSVLFSGMADVDLTNIIDSLSYNLIK